MNKEYNLKAVVNNRYIMFNKTYKSHSDALHDAFKFLEKNYEFDVQVIDEFVNEKNNLDIEYILSNHDRFIISRI